MGNNGYGANGGEKYGIFNGSHEVISKNPEFRSIEFGGLLLGPRAGVRFIFYPEPTQRGARMLFHVLDERNDSADPELQVELGWVSRKLVSSWLPQDLAKVFFTGCEGREDAIRQAIGEISRIKVSLEGGRFQVEVSITGGDGRVTNLVGERDISEDPSGRDSRLIGKYFILQDSTTRP